MYAIQGHREEDHNLNVHVSETNTAHGAGFFDKRGFMLGGEVPTTLGRLQQAGSAAERAGDSHTCQPLRSGISKTINFMLKKTQPLKNF